MHLIRTHKHTLIVIPTHRRRRWGYLGGTGPPGWCPNFGQFYIFWAILHQNFGQYCVKILGNFMSFGQVCLVKYSEHWIEKTVSRWVRTFFFFFLEVTTIWTEKTIDLSGNFQVIFRAKLWCPPQIILSSYAHAYAHSNCKEQSNAEIWLNG